MDKISIKSFQEGPNGIRNESTYENYRSLLNTVNEHFGLERDHIHYNFMNSHADAILEFLLEKYKIANHEQLRTKISALSSLMTRCDPNKYHQFKRLRGACLRRINIVPEIPIDNIPDWETEVLPELKRIRGTGTVSEIIALVFSYGYVLRVSEMFLTRLSDTDLEEGNYINTTTGEWVIREQKNCQTKRFFIEKKLLEQLPKGNWLLSKKNGEGYCKGVRSLRYHCWPLKWMNVALRKSYERYNINGSGRDEAEQKRHHEILGHTQQVARDYYDAPIMISNIKRKPIRIVKSKPFKPITDQEKESLEKIEVEDTEPQEESKSSMEIFDIDPMGMEKRNKRKRFFRLH